MGQEDWRRERDQAIRREAWTTAGPGRVVKVMQWTRLPFGRQPGLPPLPLAMRVSGYFTQAKFIRGMTPAEIEAALGLPSGWLAQGCVVHSLARLPSSTEYDYELTADHPGGLAAGTGDPRYPPGQARTHQWCIREIASVPVDLARAVELSPGQAFPG